MVQFVDQNTAEANGEEEHASSSRLHASALHKIRNQDPQQQDAEGPVHLEWHSEKSTDGKGWSEHGFVCWFYSLCF